MAAALQDAEKVQADCPFVRVIAITPVPVDQIEQFRTAHHIHLPILFDASKQYASRYNAAWSPRAYLLTKSGRLLWHQDQMRFNPTEAEQAIKLADMGAAK